MTSISPGAPIAITRRHHLQCFTEVLEDYGVSTKTVAKRLGLPMWHCGGANDWIPLQDTFFFFQEAARVTGDTRLGLLISRENDPSAKSTYARLLNRGPTLFHVLKGICEQAKQHTSMARVWMVDGGDRVWLCRTNYSSMNSGNRQHEQYVIGFFLGLIRKVAGPDWQPEEVWVSAPDQYRLEDSEDLSDAVMRYDKSYSAIALPKSIVCRPLEDILTRPAGKKAELAESEILAPAADDFSGSLCQILISLVEAGPTSLNETAEILRLHPRTLQRRLRSEGSTYQALLDEARFRLSAEMLKRPGATVREVGQMVGYSELSNFSRAFKRFAGVSPREYARGYPPS